jgi:peroxiredoxin
MKAHLPTPPRWLIGCLRIGALLLLGASAAAADPGTLAGRAAPDFALPSFGGDNVRLSEYVGQPVIVSFWSSNCAECSSQLARLNQYYDVYRSSGLVVLAVSVDDDMQRASRYAQEHHTDFPLLLDQAKAVARAFAIDRLPTTVLIDRSGVVRYLHDAYRANDVSYIKQIRALLDDDAPDNVGLVP